MSILISAGTLASEAAAVVFDCRFSLVDRDAGRRAYEAGHIPGARYADLERDLSKPAGRGCRHPLPDRDELAERMRAWGVGKQSTVVCYDQNSGALAGRLWWLVRWLGHREVYVLDGGLDAWIAAGLGTETAEVAPPRGDFEPEPPLTRLCFADDLPDAALNLVDAREAARYRGEVEPFDAVAGHIPGAISAPFTENLVNGQFRSSDELLARFRELGVKPERDTVCYCGSGVTATHNVMALLLAGHPEPMLYAGSWSDWISDASRPVALG